MRARWASRRALVLHLGILIWFPACLAAGWWQANRALEGNSLSYVYSVEWPALALVGVWVWWLLIHTDADKVGLRGLRRAAAEKAAAEGAATDGATPPAGPVRRPEEEDEALAAYNDHLAALAAEQRAKSWRRT